MLYLPDETLETANHSLESLDKLFAKSRRLHEAGTLSGAKDKRPAERVA